MFNHKDNLETIISKTPVQTLAVKPSSFQFIGKVLFLTIESDQIIRSNLVPITVYSPVSCKVFSCDFKKEMHFSVETTFKHTGSPAFLIKHVISTPERKAVEESLASSDSIFYKI